MRKLIFFIIIFIAYSGHANWEKIGQDIDGEASEDNIWTYYTDETSGRAYWYNEITYESLWAD